MVNGKANVFCFPGKWDSLLSIMYFLSNLPPHPLHFLFFVLLSLSSSSASHIVCLFTYEPSHLCLSFCFMTWYTKSSNHFLSVFDKFQSGLIRWGLFPWINCTWHKHSECVRRHMAELKHSWKWYCNCAEPGLQPVQSNHIFSSL